MKFIRIHDTIQPVKTPLMVTVLYILLLYCTFSPSITTLFRYDNLTHVMLQLLLSVPWLSVKAVFQNVKPFSPSTKMVSIVNALVLGLNVSAVYHVRANCSSSSCHGKSSKIEGKNKSEEISTGILSVQLKLRAVDVFITKINAKYYTIDTSVKLSDHPMKIHNF